MLITGIKKSFLLILFFLSACTISNIPENEIKTSALHAYPPNISLGKTITLSFPQNHPKNLAVRNPSGIWYSIHNSEENVFVIPNKKYTVAKKLKLNTHTLQGITWKNGIKKSEKVFKEKGEYLIYMANNLETEPENTFHYMTTVNYLPK